eukprot:GHUV01017509.1.p1 GENE.GHUV01017509.1~~GHUV01017509.1.p1  ORF type:complete len:175 (+),score=23.19 GHUV01017509.1:798-1322(+)
MFKLLMCRHAPWLCCIVVHSQFTCMQSRIEQHLVIYMASCTAMVVEKHMLHGHAYSSVHYCCCAGQHTVLAKAAVTAEHLPVVITGAGIAGLSAAVALHKVTDAAVQLNTSLQHSRALRDEVTLHIITPGLISLRIRTHFVSPAYTSRTIPAAHAQLYQPAPHLPSHQHGSIPL